MTEKSTRPFCCANCGNWYTPIPNFEDECLACVTKSHTPHHKTGIVDCHFGQRSATYSERRMAELLAQVTAARDSTQRDAAKANLRSETLLNAEERFSRVERVMRELPEIILWAGVMEMPGMAGEPATARYKDMTALEDLVSNSRRPQSDLDVLKRSVSVCKGIEIEVGQIMAELRVAMTELRRHAASPTAERQVAPKAKGKKYWTPERRLAASLRAKQAAADQRSAREPTTAGMAA